MALKFHPDSNFYFFVYISTSFNNLIFKMVSCDYKNMRTNDPKFEESLNITHECIEKKLIREIIILFVYSIYSSSSISITISQYIL